MDFVEIHSRDALQRWLKDAPSDWANVIAMRAALRALPYVAFGSLEWRASHLLPHLRLAFFLWASFSYRSLPIFGGLEAAAKSCDRRPKNVSRNVMNASTAITAAGAAILDGEKSIALASFSIGNAAATLSKSPVDVYNSGSWDAVNADCRWLLDSTFRSSSALYISSHPLWINGPTRSWTGASDQFRKALRTSRNSYSPWIDWFDSRIEGHKPAFKIPNDVSRTEDTAIVRRLAEASSDGFWISGYESVSATILVWLEAARERAAARINEETSLPNLPQQNPNALAFRTNENGQIDIDPSLISSSLRSDAEARDRYELAAAEANAWLERCKSSNAAARLTRLLENYTEAAGEGLETAKPSLLVQRGERLRQELARYELSDHMMPPVADELLLDGRAWLSAHNMMVGLDPALMAIDLAMLGPDRQPALVPPDEVRDRAHEADEVGLLAEGVAEIIEEAADISPTVPNPSDRRSVSLGELVRNLIIETFAIALNNPTMTVTAIGAVSIVSSGVAAGIVSGISILGSVKAAEYLVSHREWILHRLGNTPTWQALIERLVDWLEQETPFRPK